MEKRKIIVIVGDAGSGKTALLEALAAANDKSTRTYGMLGDALLNKKFNESLAEYEKRVRESESDTVLYIDEFYDSRGDYLRTWDKLLQRTGSKNLVLATQNLDLVDAFLTINPETQIIPL